MKLLTAVPLCLSIVLTSGTEFSRCLQQGHAFYRYWAEEKEKIICYFFETPSTDDVLDISVKNSLEKVIKRHKQSNITEAIAPTFEDLRNFHYAALLNYPEYRKGLVAALFGLLFVRYRGFLSDDRSGLYGGELVWPGDTPAVDDFSSFFDRSFDPSFNRSNCYRFMTRATMHNDFTILVFKCDQKDSVLNYLIGFSYVIDFPPRISEPEYNWDTEIRQIMVNDISYPRSCALGDHGWEGEDGEVHCFSIVHKSLNYMNELFSIDDAMCRAQRNRKRIAMYPATFRSKDEFLAIMRKIRDDLDVDRPVYYRHRFVLFGLWYFHGAGFRWTDFSRNSTLDFIEPTFNPKSNGSLCYRFVVAPFSHDYALAVDCSVNLHALSVLCMYKADKNIPEHFIPRLSFAEENNAFHVELVDLKLLAESISGTGKCVWWRSMMVPLVLLLIIVHLLDVILACHFYV